MSDQSTNNSQVVRIESDGGNQDYQMTVIITNYYGDMIIPVGQIQNVII